MRPAALIATDQADGETLEFLDGDIRNLYVPPHVTPGAPWEEVWQAMEQLVREGKIAAIRYARENKVPFFGICLGMQMAVVEFSRSVCAIEEAYSSEFKEDAKNPVIHIMEKQKAVKGKGGTMRLGAQPCRLTKGTISRALYGKDTITERHRHRYEFNTEYKDRLVENGLILS